MKAFLLLLTGFLTGIWFTLTFMEPTAPSPRTSTSTSTPKKVATKPASKVEIVPPQPGVKCDHYGLTETLLQAASGRRELKKFEILGIKNLLTVKQGFKKTSLKDGVIQLNSSLYVINFCENYFEEVKDYLPDGAKVPAHLSR